MKTLICFLAFFIAANHLKAQGCDEIKFFNAFPWRQSGEVNNAHANYYTFSDSINMTVDLNCKAYKGRVITLSLLIPDVSESTGYSLLLLDTLVYLPSYDYDPAPRSFTIKKRAEIDSACILRIDGLDRTNLQGNKISCLIHFCKPFISVSKSNISVGDSVVFNCGYIGPTYNDINKGMFKDMDTSNLNTTMQSEKLQLITNNDNADFEPLFDKIYPGKLVGWLFKPKAAGKYVISYSEYAFYLKERGLDNPLKKYDTIAVSIKSGLETINDESSNITLYPNPANDNVCFGTMLNFEMYDALGNRVEWGTGFGVDVSRLTPGVYFVRTINNQSVRSGKLIKQ